jgi:hypothetical protein
MYILTIDLLVIDAAGFSLSLQAKKLTHVVKMTRYLFLNIFLYFAKSKYD